MTVHPISSPADAGPVKIFERIAVGVDGYAEGRDAALLASVIAHATAADTMLIAVHPEPLVVLPPEMGWTAMHKHAEATLRKLRSTVLPDARLAVETDWSVPRALERVMRREHRGLLVVGSSRHGPSGSVRIGRRTRQLLDDAQFALAITPRGFSQGTRSELRVIGVGYDGEPEAQEALRAAAVLARAAGAELRITAVVDDRLPSVGWLGRGQVQAMWEEVIAPKVDLLREDAVAAASKLGIEAEIDAVRGVPADRLLDLSGEVDLLVVGSRRWGAQARLLLGSTGEALLHDARCPVMVVPRPHPA